MIFRRPFIKKIKETKNQKGRFKSALCCFPVYILDYAERASSSAAFCTLSGVSLFKQSVCPNGHSRLKQGEQSKFKLTIFAFLA